MAVFCKRKPPKDLGSCQRRKSTPASLGVVAVLGLAFGSSKQACPATICVWVFQALKVHSCPSTARSQASLHLPFCHFKRHFLGRFNYCSFFFLWGEYTHILNVTHQGPEALSGDDPTPSGRAAFDGQRPQRIRFSGCSHRDVGPRRRERRNTTSFAEQRKDVQCYGNLFLGTATNLWGVNSSSRPGTQELRLYIGSIVWEEKSTQLGSPGGFLVSL